VKTLRRMKRPGLKSGPGLKIWAHRGSHDGAAPLENTLPAFERALTDGADGVELDVHVSADGVALVFHDETTTRLAQGDERLWLARTPAAILQAVILLGGGTMPTLDAVLDLLVGRVPVNVEIKDATALPAVLASLQRAGKSAGDGAVILSSFDADAMIAAAQVAPQWPRAVIHDMQAEQRDWRGELDRAQAAAWHVCAGLATAENVAHQQAAGRPTRVWTVNDASVAQALELINVSAVFADRPAQLRAALWGHLHHADEGTDQ
jgi:glycerophosphoryl diester phosphodiesterase